MRSHTFRRLTASAILAVAPGVLAAQDQDAEALAKQLANPVAALISVPFQLNYDSGYDNGGEKWLLNVQPVIPINLGETWNLISGTILPVIKQSNVATADSQSGLGDTVQSFFFSPKQPTAGGWILGVGPAKYPSSRSRSGPSDASAA